MKQATDPTISDVVVVVPGIMGSELRDTATGDVLWGHPDPGWYLRAWLRPQMVEPLKVSDDERAGRVGRVTATRLLTFPAFAPVLRGIEYYGPLMRRLATIVRDDRCLFPFAYDWRLSALYNAQRLADESTDRLHQWRSNPDGDANAKLVFVCHSMGGLLARIFTDLLGGAEETRLTVTLGTPFGGAVRAVEMLHSGQILPRSTSGRPLKATLLRERHRKILQSVARSMPGLHDLLPSGRCVVDDKGGTQVLTSNLVGSLGGDVELAQASIAGRLLNGSLTWTPEALRPVVGTAQPTPQSLTVDDGVLTLHRWSIESDGSKVDRQGDGTVARDDASPAGGATYLAQSHGGLASAQGALQHLADTLTERVAGQALGQAEIGFEAPDVVAAGEPFDVEVHGAARTSDASGLLTPLQTLGSGRGRGSRLGAKRRDGRIVLWFPGQRPGLHRLDIGGVTQIVLVADPEDLGQ